MNTPVLAAVAGIAKSEPTVKIVHTNLSGNSQARVIAEVVHTSSSRENPELVLKALGSATNNKLRAVAGTFRSLSKGRFDQTLVGVMAVNKMSKPFTQETVDGYKSVSSNMFMDTEKELWRVEETAAGKMLVKDSSVEAIGDMRELLSSICSSSMWKVEASSRLTAKGGDFISYVGPAGELKFGFVAASVGGEPNKLFVVAMSGEETEIEDGSITQVVDGESLPELEVEETADTITAAARGKSAVNEMVEYYRRIYGHNKEFFDKLVSRIKADCYA